MKEILPGLCYEHNIDLVVGNGENVAGGLGLTPSTAEELFDSGIDVITTGNHIWAYKEIIPYLDSEPPLLRPLNYPPANPGRGYLLKKNVLIVNLVGRVFIGHFDCPFRAMDQLLAEFEHKSIPIIVDFHAEYMPEKKALAFDFDGKVSLVVGTHTHVQSADEVIMPKGTGYITDLGLCGGLDSVIGMEKDDVIRKFLNQTFMVLAIAKGLDGAIVNPLDQKMMANIIAAEALMGKDEYCTKFLEAYRAKKFEF